MQKLYFFTVLGFCLFFAGCGVKTTSETYLRENVDLAFINRIAVMPFENNTNDSYAADRSRNITITQFLALGIADVIDKGLVDSVLLEEAVEFGKPIDQATIKRLGQRLNVQAFLIGTVDEAGETGRSTSSSSEISFTLRLIDARAAMILWQASGHGSGDSFRRRLFGLASIENFKVSSSLVKKLLSSIPIIKRTGAEKS